MKYDISKIDENLKVNTNVEKNDVKFFNVKQHMELVNGLIYEDGLFRRMPKSVGEQVSAGVKWLYRHTAGGRIRFITNSEYIVLSCRFPEVTHFSHMPLTGTSGFDIYLDNVFYKTFVPPADMTDGYESVVELDGGEHEIIIGFPLYNAVSDVFIGIQDTAELKTAHKYSIDKPVVFYGSSITQGGCASRPGTSYQAFLSRKLDCDYINLGFSGSAKGEELMAEYISGLEMSVFVMDYDYNAPSIEHLKDTHEKFFRIIREKQPELPIIMISRTAPVMKDEVLQRREVISDTYNNAVSAGDKNVWFIDGSGLFGDDGGSDCTVDGCHPTDMGFWRMAEGILPILSKALS